MTNTAIKCEYCGTHNVYRKEWLFCMACGAAIAPAEHINRVLRVTPEKTAIAFEAMTRNAYMNIQFNNLSAALKRGTLTARDFSMAVDALKMEFANA